MDTGGRRSKAIIPEAPQDYELPSFSVPDKPEIGVNKEYIGLYKSSLAKWQVGNNSNNWNFGGLVEFPVCRNQQHRNSVNADSVNK